MNKYPPQSIHQRCPGNLFLILLLIIAVDFPHNIYAQRSRRTATTHRPQVTKTKEEATTQSVEQLEARNKELLKQILDLQYERDFYRRKLSEWTEAQRLALEEEKRKAAEAPAPQPTQPLVVPYPATGWQPPAIPAEPYRPRFSPADSVYRLARQAIQQGKFLTAQERFAQLLTLPGCSDRHYLAYGVFLYRMSNYPKALEILKMITEQDSLQGVAAFYRARVYQEQGAGQLASVEALRCKYLSPNADGYNTIQAYTLLTRGLLDSAETIFKQLLDRPTGYEAELYAGLAEIAYQRQDQAAEIYYLQASLGCEPSDIRNCFDLGVALLERQDYQASLVLLQTAAQYPQPSVNIHFYLGQALYRSRHWEQALQEFAQIDPARWGGQERAFWLAKTYYLLSLVAKAGGDFHGATNYLRKAREIYPEASSWMQAALGDLAQLFENEREYNRAMDTYLQQLRLTPQDGEVLLKLGELYFKIGDLAEAKRIFSSVLRFPNYASQAATWLKQLDAIVQ